MAYNKTEWVNGDIITAEKLNKIEQGIYDANGISVPTSTSDLINDSGFITLVDLPLYSGAVKDG